MKAHEFADVFPMLSDAELKELADDIKAHGLRHPILTFEGKILDGRNRFAACERAGVEPDFETFYGTRDEALHCVVSENLVRRHLDTSQREMVAGRIANLKVGRPEINAPIGAVSQTDAAALLNVSRRGVQRAVVVIQKGTKELQSAVDSGALSVSAAAEIATVPAARQKEIVAKGEAEILRASREIKKERARVRVETRAEKQKEAVEKRHPLRGESYRLIVSQVEKLAEHLDGEKVDAIITDPPYPAEFLPTLSALSELAARVLKPGGHCLVMYGQANVQEAMRRLSEHLSYQWTLAYLTPGQSTQVFGRRVKSNWKPVLWFTNGRNEWEHVEDTIKSGENDKRFHEWGQSVSGMAAMIERFTVPNALVLDPFVGAGTTGVAAVATGRLFIGSDIDPARVAQSAERLVSMKAVA